MDPLLSIVGLSLIALGLAWYCYRTGQRDGAYEGYEFGWADAKQFYEAKHADELACPCCCDAGEPIEVKFDCTFYPNESRRYEPSEN